MGLEEIVNRLVKKEIKSLHGAGYYWCNQNNIWTESIFTVQLHYRMLEFFKDIFKEKTDETVRKIIKHYHLKTVKKYPNLKEY